MPNKQAIIDNIEEYSAVELVQYIKDGIVTFNELCNETGGYFPASVRKEVQRMLAGSEDDDWQDAKRINTEEAFLNFLKTYPDSHHAEDARTAIVNIQRETANNARQGLWDSIDKNDISALRNFIQENPTDSHCMEARRLINAIQEEEFLGFDINALIDRIHAIQTDKDVNDPDAEIVNEISNCLKRKKISQNDLLAVIITVPLKSERAH